MKILLLFLLLLFLGLKTHCQVLMAVFKPLPKANVFVINSLKIFNFLKERNTDSLFNFYPINEENKEAIKKSFLYFKKGICEDTIMTEYYFQPQHTEMDFRMNCNTLKKGLTYWLKVKADGINGSMNNLTFIVVEDWNFIKVSKAIENIKP